jgi:hypothetical protein
MKAVGLSLLLILHQMSIRSKRQFNEVVRQYSDNVNNTSIPCHLLAGTQSNSSHQKQNIDIF